MVASSSRFSSWIIPGTTTSSPARQLVGVSANCSVESPGVGAEASSRNADFSAPWISTLPMVINPLLTRSGSFFRAMSSWWTNVTRASTPGRIGFASVPISRRLPWRVIVVSARRCVSLLRSNRSVPSTISVFTRAVSPPSVTVIPDSIRASSPSPGTPLVQTFGSFQAPLVVARVSTSVRSANVAAGLSLTLAAVPPRDVPASDAPTLDTPVAAMPAPSDASTDRRRRADTSRSIRPFDRFSPSGSSSEWSPLIVL